MSYKECCVENCLSSLLREEDIGVTYHKYPKNINVREAWINATRNTELTIEQTSFVCSRHFRKSDFETIRESKYLLKSDAVPSIFPWTIDIVEMECTDQSSGDSFVTHIESENNDTKIQDEVNTEPNNKDIQQISNPQTPIFFTNFLQTIDSDSSSIESNEGELEEPQTESNDTVQNNVFETIESPCVGETDSSINDTTNESVHNNVSEIESPCVGETDSSINDTTNESVQNNVSETIESPCVGETDSSINDTTNESVHNNVSETIESPCVEKKDSNINDTTNESVKTTTEAGYESNSSSNHTKEDCIENYQREISFEDDKNQGKNLEAIKKFIEDQERQIEVLQAEIKPNKIVEAVEIKDHPAEEIKTENIEIASDVINIILSASEGEMGRKKVSSKPVTASPNEKANNNSSSTLSVGSKVEAKDFANIWYPAEILEVDYDEMEVLVHYEAASKLRHDEWISVSSPRLRPLRSPSKQTPERVITPIPTPSTSSTVAQPRSSAVQPSYEHIKQEEKPKMEFSVGDRCLARWRDNRKFLATVQAHLDDGRYEIMFDDGFLWQCSLNRLSKMRESITEAPFMLNNPPSCPTTNIATPAVSTEPAPANTTLPYHTHLFDPSRDYLGSKRERREKKRKLNIKEIFNIGQKKQKKEPEKSVVEKTQVKQEKVVKRNSSVKKQSIDVKREIKIDLPDAVASIIGTNVSEPVVETKLEQVTHVKEEVTDTAEDDNVDVSGVSEDTKPELTTPILSQLLSEPIKTHSQNLKIETSNLEELKTELPSPHTDNKPEEPNIAEPQAMEYEVIAVDPNAMDGESETIQVRNKKRRLNRIRKARRLRLLHEKKVKNEVERVKSELEEMKRQVEEMKKQVMREKYGLPKDAPLPDPVPPGSDLLPGEWAAKWINGQPVGTVSELECDFRDPTIPALPRRSVQVEDKRLPVGWTKHMVRRSMGNSAGKWDVVLVSPDNKRIHTKNEMRHYIELIKDPSLNAYESVLMDFGVHRKLSRRLGWDSVTESGDVPQPVILPANAINIGSPLVKLRRLNLKKEMGINKAIVKKSKKKIKGNYNYQYSAELAAAVADPEPESPVKQEPLEDGYVYVGSLKVQIIENLLRCPAEGCFKNFRNNTLIKMHIKHYHRDMRKMLGATPKVLDLASARTKTIRLKNEVEQRPIKVKINRRRHVEHVENKQEENPVKSEYTESYNIPTTPVKSQEDNTPVTQDSPKLRDALVNKPVKRPKVLLPVRKLEIKPESEQDSEPEPTLAQPHVEQLDFECAISTHTVTNPLFDVIRKKKRFAKIKSEDEDWGASDMDTRSSCPRSGTPDSKIMDKFVDTPPQPMSSESNEEPTMQSMQKENNFTLTESGEKIKIVHMKREEIINCHCGFREEDGLMIQCELCLCWQHALCHNIHKTSDVPDKYTCSICLNPRRGRRSQRFLHDQDRLYEGLLPGARPSDSLRRSHELTGNLIRIQDAMHALRVKYYVAVKKDHPKLYLWAKEWESDESFSQDRLNADYVDINAMISDIGKENLPLKTDDIKDMSLHDIRTPPSSDVDMDRLSQRGDNSQLGSQALLSGLLSSPGSLDLPISTSELEKLAKSVQAESDNQHVIVPQPEAAIENSACRERLLKHIQRCQAVIDARLDSIEAQVAELESRHPSFEDDETPEYFPRTKQTIQMLMRDLENMEELGLIT